MTLEPYEHFNNLVDEVIAGKRPSTEMCQNEEELEMLQMAVLFRSAAIPAVEEPSEELKERVHQIVASQTAQPKKRDKMLISRRRVLFGLVSSAAASAAAGVAGALGIERLVNPPAGTDPDTSDNSDERVLQVYKNGQQFHVGTVAALNVGEATPFDAGAISGFLVKQANGQVSAVSAICTHLGCKLRWNKENQDILCPCHDTTFTVDGVMKSGPPSYTKPLPPLPKLNVKVEKGEVYIWSI